MKEAVRTKPGVADAHAKSRGPRGVPGDVAGAFAGRRAASAMTIAYIAARESWYGRCCATGNAKPAMGSGVLRVIVTRLRRRSRRPGRFVDGAIDRAAHGARRPRDEAAR